MAKKGRPSRYTKELGNFLCQEIAKGRSLRKACLKASKKFGELRDSTVLTWVENPNFKEFSEQYARARDRQPDVWADEIIDIADDGTNDTYIDEKGNTRTDHDVVNRSRLRVDARKWLMSKLKPNKYGDMGQDNNLEIKERKRYKFEIVPMSDND